MSPILFEHTLAHPKKEDKMQDKIQISTESTWLNYDQ